MSKPHNNPKVTFCTDSSIKEEDKISAEQCCCISKFLSSFLSSCSCGTLPIIGGLLLLLLVVGIGYFLFSSRIEHVIASVENSYTSWLSSYLTPETYMFLPLIGFIGGLIASLSACIISLLPLTLGYIGTREVKSKREAFLNASGFVLGVVLVLSLLGLVSSFAAALIVDYKGHTQIAVGAIVLIMGLSLLGLFEVPLPQFVKTIPDKANPFVIGTTFALVSSPCASPLLLAVLAMAGSTGNQLLSIATMASYALGYTVILFLASIITGFTKQTSKLREYSGLITRLTSIIMILAGGYYVWSGISWFS